MTRKKEKVEPVQTEAIQEITTEVVENQEITIEQSIITEPVKKEVKKPIISDVEVAKKLVNIHSSAQSRNLEFNLTFEYVKKLDENIKNQDRTIIPPLELDIVSEKHKIAIEIDGLYWHSEISGKKNKFYHSVKRKNTNNCGYKLIQIFEDEWIEKQKIVKSRLKNSFNQNKRKIYARKCIVKELPTEIKSKFLKKYHIQGNDRSNIHLGLFYKNRLVSVMTFNPYRIALGNSAKNNCYELTRFCSILNFSIIGGASKLLKYFEKNYKPTEIISYADKRWSDGNLYNKLGFNLVGTTQPNYWYIVKNQRKHRFAYRKSELQKLLKQYDNNLSEWDNMQLNGYDRIWDCGSLKFQKNY